MSKAKKEFEDERDDLAELNLRHAVDREIGVLNEFKNKFVQYHDAFLKVTQQNEKLKEALSTARDYLYDCRSEIQVPEQYMIDECDEALKDTGEKE